MARALKSQKQSRSPEPHHRWPLAILALLFLLLLGLAAHFFLRNGDPTYAAHAWMAGNRYGEYDSLIRDIARKRGLDPLLVKAVVWRESAFQPDKTGTSGERGLMQVGEAAARDWARAEKMETFVPTDLFDPKTNLAAGTWYLKKALDRWKQKADPIPFALAQYNAGRGRVDRWLAQTSAGENANADDLVNAIDFPSTRKYIEDITQRYAFYRKNP